MLSLYNLPKDLLVKLISVIKRRTDNQYDKYIVVTYDDSLRTDIYDNELGIKYHILNSIWKELISKPDSIFNLDDVPKNFSISTWKLFVEKCATQYSLQHLMTEAEKLTVTPLEIIKGKIILECSRPYFYQN